VSLRQRSPEQHATGTAAKDADRALRAQFMDTHADVVYEELPRSLVGSSEPTRGTTSAHDYEMIGEYGDSVFTASLL
jgi:hypothetical protein